MTHKTLMLAALMIGPAAYVQADTVQKLTVDGKPADGEVVSIRFNGDDALLTLADGSTQAFDMERVALTLTYNSGETAVRDVRSDTAEQSHPRGVYTLDGRYAGPGTRSLPKGVYIVNGKKTTVK